MMTPADDQTLLQAWARDASEEAFAVIARKYAGLIYHAALRRTGRAELAEEAAQNTLAILARKAARVARHPGPAAWLHRTACYEAAKLLRRERRHEDRMKNLHLPNDAPHDSSDLWSKAAPVLDAALDALPEADRLVLMLKYFDGWTFERMSERLGGQAAAWRQRGSRAVERLRRVLAGKGLTLSAAVIAGGLGATLSLTAPPAVAAALTSAPLKIATGLTWKSLLLHTLHTMNMKQAAIIAGVCLAAVIPLGFQYRAVAGSQDRVMALEMEVRSLHEAVASPGKSAAGPASSITGAAKNPGAVSADKVDLAAWAAVLEEARRGGGLTQMTALMAIEKTLDGMDPDAVETLIMAAVRMELPGKRRVALIEQLLSHYQGADQDGRRSVELIARLSQLNGSELTGTLWQESNNGASMLKWAKKDPSGARAWLEAHLKEDAFTGKSLEKDNFLARDLTGQLFTGLYAVDRAGAMQFLSSLDDEEKGYALDKLSGELRSDSGREELLKLIALIEQPENRRRALNSAVWDISHDLKEAGEFITRAALPARENRELMVEAARISDEGDIQSRMAWLRSAVPPEEQTKAVGSFLGISASEDEAAARKALDAELAAGANDELLSAFIGGWVGFRPPVMEEGLRMALRLTDAGIRERTVQEAVKSWPVEEVRAAGKRVGMPAEEIERALAAKKP